MEWDQAPPMRFASHVHSIMRHRSVKLAAAVLLLLIVSFVGVLFGMGRRFIALEHNPLCLMAKRPSDLRAGCLASASINKKPADRGRASHYR